MSRQRFRVTPSYHSPPPSQPLGTPPQPETPVQPSAHFRWASISTPSSITQPQRSLSHPVLHAAPGIPFTIQSNPNFRLRAKRFLLTYSQVGDVHFSEAQMMLECLPHPPVQWAGVVERHEDGHFHWHIICIFDKIPNVRFRSASRVFDVLHLHPHIRLLPHGDDIKRAWDYIHKDPLSERLGPWSGPVDDITQELTSSRAIWSHIIAAETEADFKMRCSALDPKTYANNFSHLCIYMAHHYEKVTPTYISKYSHFPHLPQEITDWVNNEMMKCDRPKALIIWGPSRTGKTAWARSLGPHSYHNFQMNGAEFDETQASYIVLDDIDPASFPQYKSWLGAQREFTLNEKYCKKRKVIWGGPAIWLSNSNPLDYSSWDQSWLQANSVIVHLDHKLYDLTHEMGAGTF